MQSLFITATGTNVGKTHTTLKLIEALSDKGLSVGVFKPIETGVNDTPLDGLKLLSMQQTLNKELNNLKKTNFNEQTSFPINAIFNAI